MTGQRPGILPGILVVPERVASIANALADRYDVHRHWQIDDLEGFLEGPGREVDCLIVGGRFVLDAATMARLPQLGLVACVSVGYEHLDVDWCRAHGIAVTAGRAANAPDVAEYAIALLLAAWCDLGANDAIVRSSRWRIDGNPKRRSLHGRRVGIVGMGAIGRAIGDRLEPFGVELLWWGPSPKPDVPHRRAASLLALAEESDVLVVACRADDDNRGMIDQAVIDAVGPEGLIVNIARGSLVDEDAIRAALVARRLGGFATDVFVEEPTPADAWRDVPHSLLSNHVAGATFEGRDALHGMLIENVDRFHQGLPLLSPVS